MTKKIALLFIPFVCFTMFLSCKETPGEGGNAQIKGTYWVRNYDPFFTIVQGRYPAVNTTVYLFFGDDTSPGTSAKTNSNGEFEFKYLRKGKYKVVAYSKQFQSNSSTPNETAVETAVNITKSKQVTDIGLDTLNQ